MELSVCLPFLVLFNDSLFPLMVASLCSHLSPFKSRPTPCHFLPQQVAFPQAFQLGDKIVLACFCRSRFPPAFSTNLKVKSSLVSIDVCVRMGNGTIWEPCHEQHPSHREHNANLSDMTCDVTKVARSFINPTLGHLLQNNFYVIPSVCF